MGDHVEFWVQASEQSAEVLQSVLSEQVCTFGGVSASNLGRLLHDHERADCS